MKVVIVEPDIEFIFNASALPEYVDPEKLPEVIRALAFDENGLDRGLELRQGMLEEQMEKHDFEPGRYHVEGVKRLTSPHDSFIVEYWELGT